MAALMIDCWPVSRNSPGRDQSRIQDEGAKRLDVLSWELSLTSSRNSSARSSACSGSGRILEYLVQPPETAAASIECASVGDSSFGMRTWLRTLCITRSPGWVRLIMTGSRWLLQAPGATSLCRHCEDRMACRKAIASNELVFSFFRNRGVQAKPDTGAPSHPQVLPLSMIFSM